MIKKIIITKKFIKIIPLNIKNLLKKPIKGGIPAKDKKSMEPIHIAYLFLIKEN
jgi:hypothetical protein